jgi:hypothetical protein
MSITPFNLQSKHPPEYDENSFFRLFYSFFRLFYLILIRITCEIRGSCPILLDICLMSLAIYLFLEQFPCKSEQSYYNSLFQEKWIKEFRLYLFIERLRSA